MRKAKRGPGLFDVLRRSELPSVAAPNRTATLHGEPTPLPRGEVGPKDAQSRNEAAPTERPATVGVPKPGPPGSETTAQAEPIVEVVGDRVRFSLNSLSMAVALFGLLIFLFAAFETGRRVGDGRGFRRGHAAGRASYAADAMNDIETARSQPPALDVVETLRPERVGGGSASTRSEPPSAPPGEEAAESSSTTWTRGYTYVVAQEFATGREADAHRVQAFLAENGVGTEIVRYRTGTIQLITIQGFNRRDSAQARLADELLERVHALGAKYMAAGGGYRLDGYFKLLKGSTW